MSILNVEHLTHGFGVTELSLMMYLSDFLQESILDLSVQTAKVSLPS